MVYRCFPVTGLWLALYFPFVLSQSLWPPGVLVLGLDEQFRIKNFATDGENVLSWNDATLGEFPATLTIYTPEAITLTGITLISNADGWPTHYRVEGISSAGLLDQAAELKDAPTYLSTATFPSPVTATEIRITIYDAHTIPGISPRAMINEVSLLLVKRTSPPLGRKTNSTLVDRRMVSDYLLGAKADASIDANGKSNANINTIANSKSGSNSNKITNSGTSSSKNAISNSGSNSNKNNISNTNSEANTNSTANGQSSKNGNEIMNVGSDANTNSIANGESSKSGNEVMNVGSDGNDNGIAIGKSSKNGNQIMNVGSDGNDSDIWNALSGSDKNGISNTNSDSNANNIASAGGTSDTNNISNTDSDSNANNIADAGGSDSDSDNITNSGSNNNSNNISRSLPKPNATSSSSSSESSTSLSNAAATSSQSPNASSSSSPPAHTRNNNYNTGIILSAVAGSCVFLTTIAAMLYRVRRRSRRGQPQIWHSQHRRWWKRTGKDFPADEKERVVEASSTKSLRRTVTEVEANPNPIPIPSPTAWKKGWGFDFQHFKAVEAQAELPATPVPVVVGR